jgi:GTP cyclohydrolase I
MNREKIERGVRLLLEGLELDLSDRNLVGTPRRVARMYAEFFSPKKNNFATFPETHSNMIILRGHEIVGVCPHHLLPVRMRVYIAYIPNKRVLGLSKLARCIEGHLTRPVLQETLTDDIAQDLQLRLDPKGVGCVVVGMHGCMRDRGVHTSGDVVTSSMTGVFFTNSPTRDEFLRLIGRI